MTKKELKKLIKECLVELLTDGLGSSLDIAKKNSVDEQYMSQTSLAEQKKIEQYNQAKQRKMMEIAYGSINPEVESVVNSQYYTPQQIRQPIVQQQTLQQPASQYKNIYEEMILTARPGTEQTLGSGMSEEDAYRWANASSNYK